MKTKAIATRVVLFAAVALFVGAGLLLPSYNRYRAANARLKRMPADASEAEIREICHDILQFRFREQHDLYFTIRDCGDMTSVPVLLRRLKLQTKPGMEDGGWCITDHILDALREITGEDAGKTYSEWSNWWKERKGQHQHAT